MNYNQDNTYNLIVKTVSGNATPEEISLLEEWANTSTDNRSIIDEFQKVWDHSENIITQSEIQRDKLILKESYLSYMSGRISSLLRYSVLYKLVAVLA
ncbi:MAG: hypothetical protein PHG29_13305, partial [Prolixibacteraceae bacterium]|nr:hypothetical protein [Prolixibacteraceae bacterium]